MVDILKCNSSILEIWSTTFCQRENADEHIVVCEYLLCDCRQMAMQMEDLSYEPKHSVGTVEIIFRNCRNLSNSGLENVKIDSF